MHRQTDDARRRPVRADRETDYALLSCGHRVPREALRGPEGPRAPWCRICNRAALEAA